MELKRKQEYKNSYIRPQLVDLPKVVKHVRRLQERKNPYFKDISLNLADYEEVCAKEDPVGHDMIFGGDNDVTTAEPDDKHAKFVNDGRESADAAKPDQHREGANLIGLMDCLTMAEPDDEHKEDVHDGEQAADAVDPDNEDKDEDDSFKALMDELAEANPDGNVDLFMLILWYTLNHLAWPGLAETDDIHTYDPDGQQMRIWNEALDLAQYIYMVDRFVPRKIYAASEAPSEYNHMNKQAVNNQEQGGWFTEQHNTLKVVGLNIRNLRENLEAVLVDPNILFAKANLIHLCETGLGPADDHTSLAMPGYTGTFTSVGEGRGIATYHKAPFHHEQDVVRDDCQVTCFRSPSLDSLHVYRSSSSLPDLINDLQTLINDDKPTLITGDLNICMQTQPNNHLTCYLMQAGFKQLVQSRIRVKGGHAYFREGNQPFEELELSGYNPYYVDKDALCVQLTLPQVKCSFFYPTQ